MASVVACYRGMTPDERELELRLGTVDPTTKRFVPGVDEAVFQALERDLSETLPGDDVFVEVVDYQYDANGQTTRTRVEFDSDDMKMSVAHVHKKTHAHCVCQSVGSRAFKIACATERAVLDPPQSCRPTFLRVKQRRRFRQERDGDVVWIYELSRTWSGDSRSAVERSQHLDKPTFEVEIELVDASNAYLSQRSDEAVARSLAAKGELMFQVAAEVHLQTQPNEEVPTES